MQNKPFISFILPLLTLAVLGMFFFVWLAQKPTPGVVQEDQVVQPETLASGTFPPNSEPIDISIEGVDSRTVQVSWDDSQFNAFYLLVFDAEEFRLHSPEALIWAISSLPGGALPSEGLVTSEDVTSFIPSRYTLGDVIVGFENSPEPTDGALTVGNKYYIQVSGFTEAGDTVFVNQEFTFKASCLPPNCQ